MGKILFLDNNEITNVDIEKIKRVVDIILQLCKKASSVSLENCEDWDVWSK